MKRFMALLTALSFPLVAAAQVWASDRYPPSPKPGPPARAGAPDLAFTGSEVSLGLIAIVLLVSIGLTALFIASVLDEIRRTHALMDHLEGAAL